MLEPWQRDVLAEARRATLATIAPDGRPRLVRCCYAVADAGAEETLSLHVPLDDKPKRVDDPRALARVRDIERDGRASLLVERWSEDWSQLAWLRLDGRASLVEPGTQGHADAVEALRARYPQYRSQAIDARPVIRVGVTRISGWRASG